MMQISIMVFTAMSVKILLRTRNLCQGLSQTLDQWEWYKVALLAGGAFAYTDVYEKDGRAVITISTAIDEEGDVLAIDVDVSALQAVMSDKFSDENGILSLFDTSGNLS